MLSAMTRTVNTHAHCREGRRKWRASVGCPRSVLSCCRPHEDIVVTSSDVTTAASVRGNAVNLRSALASCLRSAQLDCRQMRGRDTDPLEATASERGVRLPCTKSPRGLKRAHTHTHTYPRSNSSSIGGGSNGAPVITFLPIRRNTRTTERPTRPEADAVSGEPPAAAALQSRPLSARRRTAPRAAAGLTPAAAGGALAASSAGRGEAPCGAAAATW